jgi:hypothetical protein
MSRDVERLSDWDAEDKMYRLIAPMLVFAACHGAVVGPESDACAIPTGIDLATLDSQLAGLVMQRSLVCNDHRHGRITDDEYRKTVAAIDAKLVGKQLIGSPRKAIPEVTAPALIDWATSVVEFSTQYSDHGWSAQQVLGPPDVFPAYGDVVRAWASKGADDRDEFIEVGFERPGMISAVEVYETYNPGAIDRIELVTVRGRRIDVPISGPPPLPNTSARRQFEFRCTKEPIASVRIHLDSQRVPGWNEIDAIGIVPCSR